MEGFIILGIILFAGGVGIGAFFVWKIIDSMEPIGTIRISSNDPDSGPYMFLEIDRNKYGQLSQNKLVLLRVEHSA